MSMHRGGKNRAREKSWPGAHAREFRELKETGFSSVFEIAHRPGRRQIGEEARAAFIAEQSAKIDVTKLVEHIAMPDWQNRLLPLFMFRGANNPYRIRALQNVAYGMFLAGSESFGEGGKLFPKGDRGHLCGLHAELQTCSIRNIFGRLRGSKKFTDSVSKAFTEYVEWIHPYPCVYMPVPLYSPRRGDHAWWRKDAPLKQRIYLPRVPDTLSYPYVRGTPRPEHELLMQVHGLIPSRIQGDLRADLCQDMFVAILSGDIRLDQIPETIKRYAQEARKTAPNHWRDVPLDFVIDDEAKPLSRIPVHRHTADFVPDLCEQMSAHEEESNIPAARWNEQGVIVHREVNLSLEERKAKESGCDGKERFRSQAEAVTRADALKAADQPYHAYLCRFCRGWHIGHAYRVNPAPCRTHAEVRESEARMTLTNQRQYVRCERPKWKMLRGSWGAR